MKFVWKMLNGSFDLLGIKLKGEDCVVCCCWLNGIPLIVGIKGWPAGTIARTVGVDVVVVGVVVGVVVVVVVTLVVVVGFLVVVVDVVVIVVVVVGGGGGGVVTVVVASVTVVLGLMTSILEGFKFNWFLDFDCIRDLNDFRGNLKGLRVGLVKLTGLLVSSKLAMISSVVSTVVGCCVVCGDGGGGVGINDCGVSPAGSDSSWLATSSLPVS